MKRNKQCFEMIPTFTVVCKNSASKYLLLENNTSKKLNFYNDDCPIPCDLPFSSERLVNLKLGIPITFKGIIKFEYKIKPDTCFQIINTIYYAETSTTSEIFDKETNEIFDGMKLVWLEKNKILESEGGKKISDMINHVENKKNIYDLNYFEDELDVFA